MKRRTLKENFSQQIINKILSGELKCGEKIKSESELAKEHFVSQSVVHRGLLQLSRKGFLAIKPRVGTYVTNYLQSGNVETVIELMKYTNSKFDDDHIQTVAPAVKSLIEIKGAIDTLSVTLIGENLSIQDGDRLKNIIDRFESCCCAGCKFCENCCQCTEILFDFFCTLSEISGNAIIPLMYHSFRLPMQNLWTRFLQMHTFAPLQVYADDLLQALKNKNTEGATLVINNSILAITKGGNNLI